MASRQRSYATTKKLIVIMATTDPRKGDELGVPIFQGKIDKSLFVTSLQQLTESTKRTRAAA